MLEQGQFIWTKYAFDELCTRNGLWTASEIKEVLPIGFSGVYMYIFNTLQVGLCLG